MAKGAPEPQQGGGGGGDRSLDFLWLVVMIVGAALLIWHFAQLYLTMFVFKVKLYEIYGINFAIHYWNVLADLLHLPSPNLQSLHDWEIYINENFGAPAAFDVLAKLSYSVGKYIAFPCGFILIILGVMLYIGGTANKFKNVFNTKLLRLSERNNWPQIAPILKLDLVKVGLDEQPWAMASNPMLFCKQNNLLREEMKNGQLNVSLRRGAAYRVLSLQLGARWRGVEALPEYVQALFAIFTARINGEKKIADELMDAIALSANSDTLNFHNSKELARKYANNKSVQKIIAIHGYVLTVMASLLVASREAGVLSTAEIIWLKAIDRRLWYMLNSVGRYTAVAEIAGAFSHWLSEKKLGLPLMVPMVEEAVKGLDVALSEILYKPEEK